MNGMKAGVSVVICCYNSEARIIPTLQHLAKQECPTDLAWEVILVNNNSSDDTVAVAKKYWEADPNNVHLIVVNEERPGLSFAERARNCKGSLRVRYLLR